MIVWIICMPFLFWCLKTLRVDYYRMLPHHFHFGVQKILGMEVEFRGSVHDTAPTLFVSNHISYLDVFALGTIRAFFIAKSEVANWPVLGQLARFQNTLFFERSAGRAKHQLEVMKQHLRDENNLILFPEGTSTEGVHVEPFKSSLFEAANLDTSTLRVAIQPITIAYTTQAGSKMNQAMRDHYAWYAKMPFTPHFLTLFFLQKVGVKVVFHPVCYLDEFATRKQCAEHCFALVSDELIKLVE